MLTILCNSQEYAVMYALYTTAFLRSISILISFDDRDVQLQTIYYFIYILYYYLVCIILLNSYVPAGYFLLMSRLCVSHNQFN